MPSRFLRVGIDVGGTNTDAVLLDVSIPPSPEAVLAWVKVPTTMDVRHGIESAIMQLLGKATVSAEEIGCVTIGTTHLINALITLNTTVLQPIGILRLAASTFTHSTPPFVDFPPPLRDIICGHVGFVSGGLNIDGEEIGPIIEAEIVRQCRLMREKGLMYVVVVGVFAPIDGGSGVEGEMMSQERRVKCIIEREMPGVEVVCSADVGRLGILERENASILNASLLKLGRDFVRSSRKALRSHGIDSSRLFLSCNDGTMISAEEAANAPVKVIASGPANSMIGASFLFPQASTTENHGSQKDSFVNSDDALIVIDIGGSTTDAGTLLETGFPRQASAYSEVANVQVNFAMPDVQSIGLGGGSIIRYEGAEGNRVATSVGPDSVGKDLITKALCFGGKILTATDIALAAGLVSSFRTETVELEASLVESALRMIQEKLEELVDEVKTRAAPLPAAIVGGGAILFNAQLNGTSSVLKSPLAPVANAIGAAVAKMSATLDVIVPVENGRSSAEDRRVLDQMIQRASQDCVKKGAQEGTVEVIMQDLVALPYVSNRLRVVVQVVGTIDIHSGPFKKQVQQDESELDTTSDGIIEKESNPEVHAPHIAPSSDPEKRLTSISAFRSYCPLIKDRQWIINEIDMEWLSIGCYILGCAGGGSPYSKYLETRQILREGAEMRIIDVTDLSPDSILIPVCKMGSPMVSTERPGGDLARDALIGMLKHQQIDKFAALLCIEVGGGNGIVNLPVGASSDFNVPMVDGDLMGRAYPTFEKVTPFVVGSGDINDLLPASLGSGDGTNLIMTKAKNTEMVDKALRAACVEMGCSAGIAFRPMSAKEMAAGGILRTHSLAWRLGRAVKTYQIAQSEVSIADSLIREFGGSESARLIFKGKIVATENRLVKGHSYGLIVIRGSVPPAIPQSASFDVDKSSGEESLQEMKITFKNENLVAELDGKANSNKVSKKRESTV
ncbi:hypothetical protein MMC25_004536 [Agyrium rufum]|nr:hypothetical protein [Agyrium rufum]